MKLLISNRNLSFLFLTTACMGISFQGLIMRNINYADAWQVLFFRALGFVFSITIILSFKYKSAIVVNIKKIGLPGIFIGVLHSISNLLVVFSFSKTTIANTLFTLSSIPFITAILALIILKEKISLRTILIMLIAFIGIFIMIKDGLETSGTHIGNLMALGSAICFSGFIIIMRKYNKVDMIPTSLISGIIIFVSFVVTQGNIDIPIQEILLSLFWGAALNGFMNIALIFSTRFLYASEVTLFTLVEYSLGPLWVWIFLDEIITKMTLYGGLIVMLSVATYCLFEVHNQRNKNKSENIYSI
jgi:drug/metabolite transporter (DMT)-like permease